MVQVDIFWSYSLGAGFAVAAARQLAAPLSGPAKGTASAAEAAVGVPSLKSLVHTLSTNAYFTWTVLYLALFFAPSGAYLLWGFTSWETMHAELGTLPPWLVTGFAATNVSQGVLGFAVAYWLIQKGQVYRAYLHFAAGYFCMFFILVHGWDGRGYQRFFSPTRAAFQDGWTWSTALEWFSSDVALTLYGMGVILLPVLFGMMSAWIRAGLSEHAETQGPARRPGLPGRLRIVAVVLASSLGGALGLAIVSSLLVHRLGWALGGVTALAVIAVAGVSRWGIFPWLFRQLLWIPKGSG